MSRMIEVASHSFLQKLATHVRDWRDLAPHLGISEITAEELTQHYTDEGEQSYMALLCWKQINPATATYSNLIACLLAHAPFDLAEAALWLLHPGTDNVAIRLSSNYLYRMFSGYFMVIQANFEA